MLRLLVSALIVAALAPALASGAAPKSHAVSIYVPRGVTKDCARVQPLKRVVAGPGLLRGALQALLAGPTKAERARGYGGWFSAKTAGHLRSVRITDGVAYVDFRNFATHVPNASASCGSTLLLSQLDRTAAQFPNVERAVYSFDGSRSAFYTWLQRTTPP